MNLYMVVHEGALDEFLVDAPDEQMAIEKAVEANKSEEMLGKYDDEELESIENRGNYSAWSVDMDLLGEIIKRTDCIGTRNKVIYFNGA